MTVQARNQAGRTRDVLQEVKVCTRCIMDTTDPEIEFDPHGVCSHCRHYQALAQRHLRQGPDGERELARLAEEIRRQGRGADYDCVMGVSGGVDSTFVAYTAKRLGLRPLAVHMDNGWDSELAVANIERVLKRLNIDLYTHVLDWEEFRDLQLTFLKASVPDAEIPTDHAIGAVIYATAARRGISYILSGSNVATEGILPSSWTYGISDWRYIKSVHRQFGTVPLRYFPHYRWIDLYYYTGVKKIKTVRPLNYLPYVKRDVMRVLEDKLGWKYYGGKHYESIYTRFFQGYILPRKFDIDKRKAHLSTLICSGQMTRDAALQEMKENQYIDRLQQEDREYVIKKLGVTEEEFEHIMALPAKTHRDYPNSEHLLARVRGAVRVVKRLGLLPQDVAGPI